MMACFNQLIPAGFGLFDLPWPSRRGGGNIIVYNLQHKLCPLFVPQFTSFECLVLSVTASHPAAIATIYRPPKSNTEFLSELADLLSILCVQFERILILTYMLIRKTLLWPRTFYLFWTVLTLHNL